MCSDRNMGAEKWWERQHSINWCHEHVVFAVIIQHFCAAMFTVAI